MARLLQFMFFVSCVRLGSGEVNTSSVFPKPNAEVEIGGESYSVAEVPSVSSGVVRESIEEILGEISLHDLVDGVKTVGKFLHIAHASVTASGPSYTNEKVELYKLCKEIVDLVQETTDTIHQFRRVSKRVFLQIRDAYINLLENHDDLAIEGLSSLANDAQNMEKASKELKSRFDAAKEKVFKIMLESELRKGKEASKFEKLEERFEQEEKKLQLASDLEKQAEEVVNKYNLKEDEAARLLNDTSYSEKFLEYASRFFNLGHKFNYTGERVDAMKFYRQMKLEKLRLQRVYEQQRYDLLQNMTNFLKALSEGTESDISYAVVDALHQSVGALKSLSATMGKAASFWKRLQQYCDDLQQSSVGPQKMITYANEKQLSVFHISTFKERAVRTASQWVALHYVCNTYMDDIKGIMADLYQQLEENLTYKKARWYIKKEADEFRDDIIYRQEKISASLKKHEEESLKLEREFKEREIMAKGDVKGKKAKHTEL